ncbi:hypothetical protein CPB84DRAFT_560759 [Gymnopilus junonius]|uniref:Uncharacterized protein n=1 Tax=Gymnopilus junonius TaxID=109634 RepID=A0A9P5NAY3_GYMJU|nr:hypothetical protein CPB84DRAFT_560759 [Gymnopilus junonius]
MPHQMDHNANSYLSVTFSSASPFQGSPSDLAGMYPGLFYHGRVGELEDVHLYSMPKPNWLQAKGTVLDGLNSTPGVIHVEEQIPKQRIKRGGDEL